MLQLRPNCERCDHDLAPEALAFICSFECTFCKDCRDELKGICPNCGGGLEVRPIRPKAKLATYPASSIRIGPK